MTARVLLVEDEAAYVAGLVPSLTQEGFEVDVARSGTEALDRFSAKTPDLVLLDLMLPGVSGLDVCRTIRTKSNVPIIMVTAKADETDVVIGLELGADDYVTKPYRVRELVARMRTALRRVERTMTTDTVDDEDNDVMIDGDIVIDLSRHSVKVGGQEIELTVKEFGILEALMSNVDRVLSRAQLIDMVWEDGVNETKTIDVHIMRLRSKLLAASSGPDRIKTIRGIGYRFDSIPDSVTSEG